MKTIFSSFILAIILTLSFSSMSQAGDLTKTKDGLMGETHPDKALVYFVRYNSGAFLIRSWGFVDDQFVGVNVGKSYFFTYVTPGKHLFWSKMENINSAYMEVEAGKTYYIGQKIKTGLLTANVKTELLKEKHKKRWEKKKGKRTIPTEEGRIKGQKIAEKHFEKAKKQAREDISSKKKK
jgi:hypothetical protein